MNSLLKLLNSDLEKKKAIKISNETYIDKCGVNEIVISGDTFD